MKKQTLFLFLPIFLVFFVWGLQIGDHLAEKPSRKSLDLYKLETEIPILPNGQKIILLVIVDKLETPKPDMLGLWLITYFSNEPYTTVIPVYPSSTKSEENFNGSISDSLQLKNVNGTAQLEESFLLKLNEAGLWTSGYILMDLYGFAEAIKISGGIDNLSIDSKEKDMIDELSRLFVGTESSLAYQTLLFEQICARFTLMDSLSDLTSLRLLFPEHLSSNLDLDVLMEDWQDFIKSRNGSFCIFPQAEQTAQIDK